ncbi:unnamed protein product [Amoebophrya sp. A25]|nr:unnamed protein product [Amoebophrya sp. A25]|eukprot:GSA25T00000949001.1
MLQRVPSNGNGPLRPWPGRGACRRLSAVSCLHLLLFYNGLVQVRAQTEEDMKLFKKHAGDLVHQSDPYAVMKAEAKIQEKLQKNSVSSHEGEMPRWGENGYWTKLEGITVTGGDLRPRFRRTRFDYDVLIRSARDRVAYILPELQFHKFPPRYPPQIKLDGLEHKYSPLEPIQVPLYLNVTNGPTDQTVVVSVGDPKNPTNVHDYYLRILQGPSPDLLRMSSLKVYNSYGVEIEEASETKRLSNKFVYVLQEEHEYADVYLECDKDTPYIRYDGVQYWPGNPYRQFMRNPQEHVLASCCYKDQEWTHGDEMSRTYMIKILKPQEMNLDTVEFDLQIPPALGHCERAKEGSFSHPLPTTGWDCRAYRTHSTLIAAWNSTVEINMHDEQGRKFKLLNGMPTVMPRLDNGAHHFVITIKGFMGRVREMPLTLKTNTASSHGSWRGSELKQVDMSKLVTVNPIMGEGHCVHAVEDKSKMYCTTHLRKVHLMVVYGEPDGITAELRRPTQEKVCDVELGLPTKALSVQSTKKGTHLILNVFKKSKPFHQYEVILHTTLAPGQTDQPTVHDRDYFLPSEKQHRIRTTPSEKDENRLAAIQASSVMSRIRLLQEEVSRQIVVGETSEAYGVEGSRRHEEGEGEKRNMSHSLWKHTSALYDSVAATISGAFKRDNDENTAEPHAADHEVEFSHGRDEAASMLSSDVKSRDEAPRDPDDNVDDVVQGLLYQ